MSWKIDSKHSAIKFTARHLMVTKVNGKMQRFSGVIEFDPDHPLNSSVQADIEPASINTGFGPRDANVRSALLKVKKYPVMTYRSKKIEVLDESHGRITGDLTIHGIAKEVVLDVEYKGLGKNADGSTTAGFNAVACINRKDWGLKWMALLEIGGVFVGDNVDIYISVEAVKESVAVPQQMSEFHPQASQMSAQDAGR